MKLRYETKIECVLIPENDRHAAMWGVQGNTWVPSWHPLDIIEDAVLEMLEQKFP